MTVAPKPAPKSVLLVDDEVRFTELYAQVLAPLGLAITVAESAEQAAALIAKSPPDLVVSDVRMPGASGIELLTQTREDHPDLPFLLVTAYADVRDAVKALKLGAVDYLAKPVDLDELVVCVSEGLGLGNVRLEPHDPPRELTTGVIAESVAMKGLLRDAWQVARSEVNILLTGESGTGKEVIAAFLHRASGRSKGPLVAVNCAALPGNLLSSELFGHERGAFTGAVQARKGKFREATGGTLFLDEIGDMPMELQPVFLRALQERKISPLGATGEVAVDFRLVAATNRRIEDDVAAGSFRSDLFYRLNVVSLHIPPLRERVADILPMARHFITEAAGKRPHDKRIARATARALEAYAWPGNVRELQNAMERARLLSRTDVILPESLPPAVLGSGPAQSAGSESISTGGTAETFPTLRDSEIERLKQALTLTSGNRTKAAELLGITRRGLLKKLKRFEL